MWYAVNNKGFKMKRDWETIREILTTLEASERPNAAVDAKNFHQDMQNVAYNMRLLKNAGYIEAIMHESSEGDNLIDAALATSLTNSGHDLLDMMSNDSMWTKIKEKIKSSGVNMTFDTVMLFGKKYIESAL